MLATCPDEGMFSLCVRIKIWKLILEKTYVYSRKNQNSRIPQTRRDRRGSFSFTIFLQSRAEFAGVSRASARRGARRNHAAARATEVCVHFLFEPGRVLPDSRVGPERGVARQQRGFSGWTKSGGTVAESTRARSRARQRAGPLFT